MPQRHQLTIYVPGAPPAGAPVESFDWGSTVIVGEEAELSFALFGDANVYSILVAAFSAGLSRETAWNLARVESRFLNSFHLAGKVFKRGVTIVGDIETPIRHKMDAEHSYCVTQVDRLEQCFETLRRDDVVIIDQGVADYWRLQIPGTFTCFKFSELEKNLQTVRSIINILRVHQPSRSRVIVVGGGVAGDLVGFAAGILGFRCHYIPTTLLAMIDSSLGGKVGVNFEPWGKNQVGLFSSPVGVSIWTGWLSTLDDAQLRSGLVEGLKHALLGGQTQLWQDLMVAAKSTPVNEQRIQSQILDIVSIKQAVIARDPFERGERAILNFGHTLGHALETFATKRGRLVTHGECVAIGMIHALRLSAEYCGMTGVEEMISDLRLVCPNSKRLGEMFWAADDLSSVKEEILGLLLSDKKSSSNLSGAAGSGQVKYVLLTAPGSIARGPSGAWTVSHPLATAWLDIVKTWNILCPT